MAPNPILIPKVRPTSPVKQEPPFGTSRPLLFGALVAFLLATFGWPWKWLKSGAPILTFIVLLGASKGQRILPFVPLWTFISTLNLAYSVASTSWLLYGIFTALCYTAIFVSSLFQSSILASFARRRLRNLLTHIQVVDDTLALFDLPALEIDVDVQGLMVIRGVSLSLSSLTLVAHGVEVGIKLSDDIELAIQVESVAVSLFRRITISDVYANIKGGEYEMTFGNLDTRASSSGEKTMMVSDSAMLKRAATTGSLARPPLVKMTSKMTNDAVLKEHDATRAFKSVTKVSGSKAGKQYDDNFNWIARTNMIRQCLDATMQLRKEQHEPDSSSMKNDIRAVVSTMLHVEPSIPHPPGASVAVTTLRDLSSPGTKRFMHRLPMLLRLLLSVLSYFHPIHISAVIAAGSGKWITAQLERHVFKNYTHDNAELRRLEKRILSWLSDASFVFILQDFSGLAQVPFMASFDISSYLSIADVLAYRTTDIDDQFKLKQVIRTGGADATFSIPTFLLPHHEHLLPPYNTAEKERKLAEEVKTADGLPKTARKEKELEQIEKDEANVQLAIHARLPACFDQELLNFIAALVKATKVVELEKESEAMDHEISGIKDFAHQLNKGMKDGMKKVMAEGVVNDRWIAKMVGKVTKRLETALGEIGYSGDIPVPLGPYRLPEGHIELRKILP